MNSTALISVLFDDVIPPSEEKLFSHIMPFDFIPTVDTQAGSYIGFDFNIPKTAVNGISDITMSIYIAVHKDKILAKNPVAVKTDLIAQEIENIMAFSKSAGYRPSLSPANPLLRFKPNENFYGVILTYDLKEYKNREGRL